MFDSLTITAPMLEEGEQFFDCNLPNKRYIVFDIEYKNEYTGVVYLRFHTKQNELMEVYISVLPNFKTRFCFDTRHFDAQTTFLPRTPGRLKGMVLGLPIKREDIVRISFALQSTDDTQTAVLSDFHYSDTLPDFPLPHKVLVDELGQLKDWQGRVTELTQMREFIDNKIVQSQPKRSKWGGDLSLRFDQGSGYFAVAKHNGRWYLKDPDGYAFLSVGFDCVQPGSGCHVEGIEPLFEKLPQNSGTSVNFTIHNLQRIYGDNWYDVWTSYVKKLFDEWGINTVGNWSDKSFWERTNMPYVMPVPNFPTTRQRIFRDFPDVFSEEYQRNSEEYAKFLEPYKNDPCLIGYFLANEPLWAWSDKLNLTEMLMSSSEDYASKRAFLQFIRDKYGSENAQYTAQDVEEFNLILIDRYVSIPSAALKQVAPNHLNLGMRYAFIPKGGKPLGAQHFDVFSFNCYECNPFNEIERIGKLADKPVLIGEYHFGTVDAGLTATGLRAAKNQTERARAYRLYLENALASRYCVGAHYFTLYDEHALGRFDGENFGIGVLDVCCRPYKEFASAIVQTGKRIYNVANGTEVPFNQTVQYIKRIGF